MNETVNVRQERIERLLEELRYEITRGMLEREIEEGLCYRWCVPTSRHFPDGVVACEVHTHPVPHMGMVDHQPPRLRVVK